MIVPVPVDAATPAEWPALVDELDRWGEAGRVATLWWRDDDAVTATPRLDDLLRLAGAVPVALAVIPALARPELADALLGTPGVALLQHGWSHANHARSGKKSEYPAGRPAAVVAAEIGAGRARLKALFGPRALPVLVPPWNRFAGEFLPLLARNGIAGISTMVSPSGAALPPGLAALDVHLDLVAWHGNRGFIGAATALGGLVGHLRATRLGAVDTAGPIGILTHHLIMDGPTAAFLDSLTALIGTHAASRWASVPEPVQ
jgi:peptidoglycan/xylan/chitin deacetylase (PgdA/CDA1 family)